MPSDVPLGTTGYDSTILVSKGQKMTVAMEEAHHKACEAEVTIQAMVAKLKELAPDKEEALDQKLRAYEAGKLPAPAALILLKLIVGLDIVQGAFEACAPGFTRRLTYPEGHPHPIVV